MGVIRQDPGKVMTTRGLKDRKYRQCGQCGLDKEDSLFTMNPNGQFVCPDCAGAKHAATLRQTEEVLGSSDQ